MKKYSALVLGGIAMLMVASSASAALVTCGSVGSVNSNTPFAPPAGGTTVNGPGGTASIAVDGTATITCNGFNVPVGTTLNSVVIRITDDASSPANSTSEVVWTWNYTSGPVLTGLTGNTSVEHTTADPQAPTQFLPCSQVSGPLNCQAAVTFNLATGITGGPTGNFVFTVVSSANGTAGVGTGNSNAGLSIDFNETNAVPEPGTFALIGSGLLGLGLVARKRKKA